MLCAVLTFEQKESLIGKYYNSSSIFNPIQDFYDNWVIFDAEFLTTVPEFNWVNQLPIIEYVPKINNSL
jgi:hypothetical protein